VNSPVRSKRNLKTRILLALAGLFLSLVLLEIGLRAYGFIFSAVQEYRNRVPIRQKGVYRILCLGESTTARQYPKPMEKILNERNIGVKFKVIDKGVIATNTSGILSQLEKNLDRYRPDMVVTMMGYNDKWILYYKDIPESGTGLFRHLRLYRLFRLMYADVLKKLNKEDIYSPDLPAIPDARTDQAYTELGDEYRKRGDLAGAESAYKKAIKINPAKDGAYVGLGRIYYIQGNLAEAAKAYKKAIGINPRNDNALSRLGEISRNQNNLDEAAEYLRMAIRANPNNYEPYVEFGCIYRRQKDMVNAEKYFSKSLELQPDNEWACSELVRVYNLHGDFQRSEKILKEYIARNPGNDWGYKALGVLYKEMGSDKQAEECEKKLGEFNNNEYPAQTVRNYNLLRRILKGRGVRLVCVQYPMRSIGPLKSIFADPKGVIFVDNQRVFAEAVKKGGYKEYFVDMFGGDFGHCTDSGNRLLAENIADNLLKEVFGRQALRD